LAESAGVRDGGLGHKSGCGVNGLEGGGGPFARKPAAILGHRIEAGLILPWDLVPETRSPRKLAKAVQAISDVADQTEAGVDPRSLVESLMNELAKAAAGAAKLEVSFGEKTRELEAIRDSLNKSEEGAKTDTLTGLANRRALEEFFRRTQIAAMENGEALSVLLIDIDHFKRFNDDFGHRIGDQVLRLVAKALRERDREIDLPARYSGEELIAVIPGADLAACMAVAERIRRSIAECQIARRSTSEVLPGITVSIGVGQFQFGQALADLIDRCDRALYLAKKAGRNRVVSENEVNHELAV
jgi:diguanylate cyclase